MFCQYKDIFGKSDEGLHAYRIKYIDVAAVDLIMTFVLGFIIWFFATNRQGFSQIMVILLLLGIISHRLFCVRTKVDRCLFPD
jgi:glycerol uptake facilitator-like aquaporin